MANATATLNDRNFTFELVAPEKTAVASVEERVLLPGELGDFMVLAGHTPLLAGLRPGVVTVERERESTYYFITGGIADVGNTHCMVLTPHVTPLAKMDEDKLAKDMAETEIALNEVKDRHEQEHLQEKLEILRLKIEAIKQYGK